VRRPHRWRAGLIGVLACATVLGLIGLWTTSGPGLTAAADTRAFQPGNIIADNVFFDSGALNATQIQSFLDDKGASCQAGSDAPCLKDYQQTTTSQPADSFCTRGYAGAANETAAAIIAKVAVACGINPKVLLVTLQKETGLVTRTTPTAHLYDRAMGYGCADSMNGACSAYYPGFFNQVYAAAKQFQRYAANPRGYSYRAGLTNNIQYSVDPGCGTVSVLIQNQATAGLYNYTPYVPNAAALAAGYGSSSDPCAQYGNRNFWMYFTDWFGSTQTGGHDADAPIGSLDDAVGGIESVYVGGWTFDPNAPSSAVTVNVNVDGVVAGSTTTSRARPDVARVYAGVGAGPDQGFAAVVAATPGEHTVCVDAINIGDGYSNTRLNCRTVTVVSAASRNPQGHLDSVVATGQTVTATGWTVDPDVPTTALAVHVYVDRAFAGSVLANADSPDMGGSVPGAGTAHGYLWTATLPAGTHQVCAYAINMSVGTLNPQLGCWTVTTIAPPPPFPPGVPTGALDAALVSGTTVTATGWTFDPDVPTTAIAVHFYVDGAFAGNVTAQLGRSDIGRIFPGAGPAHGFRWTGTLSPGTHTLCAYAINMGLGTGNPRLGCKTATATAPASPFPPGNPRGYLDAVVASGATVTAVGWTFDPDVPTTSIPVVFYVDGAAKGSATANLSRADVARVYVGAGSAHGFQWSGTLTSGVHQVCAVATNQGIGTGNPRLGCSTVTIP